MEDSKDPPSSVSSPETKKTTPPPKTFRPPSSEAWKDFSAKFEKEKKIEEKIRMSLDFMRESLAETGSPRFRDFWEARRLCLPLFKESMLPSFRSGCWDEFIDLSKQARHLKEMLDEQSTFAIEQIELAIKAIEEDLQNFNQLLTEIPDTIFPEFTKGLERKKNQYISWQRELHLLGAFTNRIQSLRKEIIRTDIRMRQKNKILDRLSKIGDQVFPRRKTLIKELSDAFTEDIELFYEKFFSENKQTKRPPLFALREEIKCLQGAAKKFTINTSSFTQTRKRLSSAWDQIREQEKEKRHSFEQKKEVFQKNFDLIKEKIDEIPLLCKEEEINRDLVEKSTREVRDMFRSLELSREGKKDLETLLNAARAPLDEKLSQDRKAKEQEDKAREEERKGAVADYLKKLQGILDSSASLEEMKETFTSAVQAKPTLREEEQQQENELCRQIEEKLLEKEYASASTLEEYLSIYERLEEKRTSVREELESIRKSLGGSDVDIAMSLDLGRKSEEFKQELSSLEKLLKEIEAKIDKAGE